MVILCDTREQSNHHIKSCLDHKKIMWKDKSLSFGDYSAMIPSDETLGIIRPLHFDNSIVIERKGSLEELSGNLTQGRERFKDELIRAKGSEVHLMIEAKGYGDIINHNYNTLYNEKSFIASMMSIQCEYGVRVAFIEPKNAGFYIYSILYYFARNVLLKGF